MNLQRQLVIGFTLITTIGSLGWLPTLVGNPEGGKEEIKKQPTPARSELRSDATHSVEHHSFLFGDVDDLWGKGELDQAISSVQASLPSISPSERPLVELRLALILSDANRRSESIELLSKTAPASPLISDLHIAGIRKNNLGIQYLIASECNAVESEKRKLLTQSANSLTEAESLLANSTSDHAVCLLNQSTVALYAHEYDRSEVLKKSAKKVFDQCSRVGKL